MKKMSIKKEKKVKKSFMIAPKKLNEVLKCIEAIKSGNFIVDE